MVWLGDRWFTVCGILDPLELAPELDRSAIVGRPIAVRELGADDHASTVYVRAADDAVQDVQAWFRRRPPTPRSPTRST